MPVTVIIVMMASGGLAFVLAWRGNARGIAIGAALNVLGASLLLPPSTLGSARYLILLVFASLGVFALTQIPVSTWRNLRVELSLLAGVILCIWTSVFAMGQEVQVVLLVLLAVLTAGFLGLIFVRLAKERPRNMTK